MKKPYQIKIIYYGDDSGSKINKEFEELLLKAMKNIGYGPGGGSGFNFTTNSRDLTFILKTNNET